MSMPLTLGLLAAALFLMVFCGWRGARPPDILKGPRLAPWRFMMLLFATLSFFLLLHAARLLAGD